MKNKLQRAPIHSQQSGGCVHSINLIIEVINVVSSFHIFAMVIVVCGERANEMEGKKTF